MTSLLLSNYDKSKRQYQNKVNLIDKLISKIQMINNKTSQTGIQKINKVLMMNVEIKHTSQFMIKIGKQYFVQVKAKSAIQYLRTKKKSYDQTLRKINHKINQIQRTNTEHKNKSAISESKKQKQRRLEKIGTNQQGEQIFNIIQVEGEEDQDISLQVKNKSLIKTNNQNFSHQTIINKKQSENIIIGEHNNFNQQRLTKAELVNQKVVFEEDEQDEQEEDLLDHLRKSSEDSSSSLEEIEQDNKIQKIKQDKKNKQVQQVNQSKQEKKEQKQDNLIGKSKKQQQSCKLQSDLNININKIQNRGSTINKTQQNKNNHQTIAKPPLEQKKISKFKLQKMKQKLQKQL